jgi:hypothetical protein
MCKKIIAVTLSLLIIVFTCVVSYEEAYANPLLLLVELVADGLGLTTTATTGLVASMNYANGRKVMAKNSDTYADTFLGKLANAFGYAKSYYQLYHAAQDVKIAGYKEMATYLVDKIKTVMGFTVSGDSYSYKNTNELSSTSVGSDSPTKTLNNTVQNFSDSYSQSKLTEMGITDNSNKTLVPIDFISENFIQIDFGGPIGNLAKTRYSDDYSVGLDSLQDGIYCLSIEDMSNNLKQFDRLSLVNRTGNVDYSSGGMMSLWFRLFTSAGQRYIAYKGSQPVLISNIGLIYYRTKVDLADSVSYHTGTTIDATVALNMYDIADVQKTDFYIPVGKAISVPSTASYSNVTNSTTQSKVDSSTGAMTLDVPSTSVPDDTTTDTSTDEKTFMSTVTGFISSFWTKLPLVLNDFCADITESLGGTITDESQRMRDTLQEELTQERQTIKTSADGISGTITAEGDAIRKQLEQEAEKDRTATGAVAGSVEGVQDSVDSLTDSVDSINDKLEDSTSTDGDINWGPLKVTGVLFTTKFPFSLPWDILKTFQALLIDSPDRPSWNIRWHDSVLNRDFGFIIDISKYDAYFKVAKVFVLISLNVGLIMITRRLLGGAT